MEMTTLSIGTRPAKRHSYKKRQAALKRLNKQQRRQRKTEQATEEASAGTKTRTALFAYTAITGGEIGLQVGDVLQDVSEFGEGWSLGRNIRTGETGYFPSSFVSETIK
jgi:hypothetical protein